MTSIICWDKLFHETIFFNDSIPEECSFGDRKVPKRLYKSPLFETFDIEKFSYNKTYTRFIISQYDVSDFDDDDKYTPFGAIAFSHDDNHLIYIRGEHKTGLCMLTEYIIAHNNTDYVIIGSLTSHPFVMTNKFIYENSDGSGPDFFPKHGVTSNHRVKKLTSNEIYDKLTEYYESFVNNKFH